MCFSAAVSFTASIALVTVGSISIGKSTNIPQNLLSSIPVMFGIQQFSEGILWFSLVRPEFAIFIVPATYLFLSIAQIVWPLLIPLAILQLELEPENKKMLRALLFIGTIVSCYLAYCLVFYKIDAEIDCYHILYSLYFPPMSANIVGLLYFMAVVGPLFVTGTREIRPLGISIMISLFVTAIFYQYYLISVWCFFAAIISIQILFVIKKLNGSGSQKISVR